MMRKSNNHFFNIVILSLLMVLIVSATVVCATTVKNATGQVNSKSGVNLRSKASSSKSSNVVATLNDNASIVIKKEVFTSKTSTAKSNRWYSVDYGTKSGYIRADLVDNIKYTAVDAVISSKANYRVGAGTKMTLKGSLAKGKNVKVYLKAKPVSSTKGSSSTWYRIKVGSKYYYAASTNIKLLESSNVYENMTDDEFNQYLKNQGFDSTYRKKLKTLHKAHPNWEFVAKKVDLDWSKAVTAQMSPKSISLIQRSGSSKWQEATKKEVSYYMDPRNFLTETYAFMFENLSYNGEYQTKAVVKKILSGTYLEKYDFKAEYFTKYGKEYNISPVHLASRARLETGGSDGDAINGKLYAPDKNQKKKTVYNPFNIGANTGVNDGLKYAYEHDWNTQEKAIEAGAKMIAQNYIAVGQNTIYFERFNFVNGKASHQYMANIKAPYSESNITFNSYKNVGISNEAFTFIIPIYTNMPESTSL